MLFYLFNGVARPYSQLSAFRKHWMYYLNPPTRWIGGVLGATLNTIPVEYTISETARFHAPPKQTSQSYVGGFVSASTGYFRSPGATADCQYCPYRLGNDYSSTLNTQASDKWRDSGIFLALCVSDGTAVFFFFIWSVWVKGWGLGSALC